MRMRNWLGIALLAGSACVAHAQVRISMVYGGGGNNGSTWKRDFVELHNNGTTPVDISGWSIQYSGAGSTFGGATPALTAIPANTILQPGQFYLVAEAAGAGGTLDLPGTPPAGGDVVGTIAMSATSGKVALVSSSTPLSGTGCPFDASVVDFVGYGTANCAEGTATAALSNSSAAVRSTNGCTDTNGNSSDFSIATANNFTPRYTGSTIVFCPGYADCNNNGTPDPVDISSGASQDCDHNGVPDECQLSGNDCNGNGILDACELAGHDCNGNGRLDACDLATGLLTDADNDGTPDACQGGLVVNVDVNATVQPAGVRPNSFGSANFNVEGVNYGSPPPSFASYGALRWDIPAAVAAFDTQYGAGNWEIARAYLHLVQDNAAFTIEGPVDIFYTANDTQDITPGAAVNTASQFFNYYTDFPDADFITTYDFTINLSLPGADHDGKREAYLLYDADGSNNSAQSNVGSKINANFGALTLLLHPAATAQYPAPDGDPFVAATYAGRTNSVFRGPALVLFARARSIECDTDFTCDGNSDQDDVAALVNALATGDYSTICLDPDFNLDGNANQDDVAALINRIGGGGCP